jgi:hypothetical protein
VRVGAWDGTPERPDGWPGVVPVGAGDHDADGDGTPDTVVVAREAGGAWLFSDTDGNGFADLVLDVAPDGPEPDPDAGEEDVLDVLVRLVTGR